MSHLMAPVALGDVAQLAAHVLTGKGDSGFDDRHRGQLMVLTGPRLVTGTELASIAAKALSTNMEFEDISEAEAKKVLKVSNALAITDEWRRANMCSGPERQ
jgi:uncharacterized protein YbjT (DUF2867 family)